MANPLYDVFFAGGLLDGIDQQQALHNAATLFKTTPDKLTHLFSGKPVTLKKALDKDTALKYKAALHKAGLIAAVKIHQPATTAATSTQPTATAPAAPTRATTTATNTAFNLCPTGSDLLTAAERNPPAVANIDTSAYKIAPTFLPLQSITTPAQPAPDISHLSVAAVGADLSADAPQPIPVAVPDLDHLTLAEAGAVLETLTYEQTPINPDISGISLSPAGSPVLPDEYKKPAPPPAPDVSHLSLSDAR